MTHGEKKLGTRIGNPFQLLLFLLGSLLLIPEMVVAVGGCQ
ncbi:hypothetical protein SDC9_186646 [bioreactor metagenome]|uniref:Uncharacterized protein n=1 Tax=bioreactor metagenome TaxID=1076179 RepID=A0A645HLJ6_9ZZZZ